MSKVGRKLITLSSAKIEIKGNSINLSGPKGRVTHQLPECLVIEHKEDALVVSLKNDTRKNRIQWGLHRALLANKVKGIEVGFEETLKIVGLGYKVQISGGKLIFTLGYSHKINFVLPEGVEASSDRSGQLLTLKSNDKWLLGETCSRIRALRVPEPYKGTGIMRLGESIRRKAGKAKTVA